MSGQPVNTQSDINKFRNEYLDTLNLQEQINDMNLQANKTYLLTGQLPPQSQMQDTRTNAEKLKDVELLKQSIAKELEPIAEPSFAYSIVNKIMTSPFNVDNSIIRFLAQRASNIAAELSRVYKFGIAGDENDLEIISKFIINMYSDQQNKFQTAKSYIQSQSTHGSKSNVLGANDIDIIITDFTEFIKYLSMIEDNIPNYRINFKVLVDRIKNYLIRAKDILPTTNQVQLMLQDLITPPEELQDLRTPFSQQDMTLFFETLEKLPKANQVKTLLDKCRKLVQLRNWNLLRKTLEGLENEFSVLTNIANLRPMIEIINRQREKEGISRNIQETQLRQNIRLQSEEQKDASKAQKVYIVNPYDDPVFTYPSNIDPRNARSTLNRDVSNRENEHFYDTNEEEFYDTNPNPVGFGLKKRRGRPRGSGLVKVPVPKPPNFVGFGINEINVKQLNNGIVKIRRNTKTNYMDMPSKRVSQNLQSILKTIVGGGVPKYDELGRLDEEEKEYLHKLVSRSNLNDRLSVPAPSKDQQEKDIHNFEVMRGQILSGNDSQELVKKFKLLTRKLSKQGMLPKADVDDILDLLTDLGF